MTNFFSENCYRSDVKVTPADWNTSRASTKKNWAIYYSFTFNGVTKQVQVKGMNAYKNLKDRQTVTAALLAKEIELLDFQRWNPITREFMQVSTDALNAKTPIIDALRLALEYAQFSPKVSIDVTSIIKQLETAAIALRLHYLPIGQVRPKHLIDILAQCAKNNARFTAHRHNLSRAYLMALFKIMKQRDAVEFNPLIDVPKRKVTVRQRKVLTDAERAKVKAHLQGNHPNFYRFIQIFFHSGARETELMKVRREDIDISGQRFKVTVSKGKVNREVWKTIKDIALPYWMELYQLAKAGDYIFSKNLLPNSYPIRPDQLGRRWKKYVKVQLGIDADLYALKHLNTTQTVDELGAGLAALHNSHTSTAMVNKVYDVGRDNREHERLKGLGNEL